MKAFINFVKPIILRVATSPQVKALVVELLEKYAKTTDNSIDDTIVAAVKAAIFKDQITGEVASIASKFIR